MRLPETFQFMNRLRRLNRLVQVVLIVSLLAALNTLAMQRFQRWDLNQDARYALSAETVAWLEQIREPVSIFVTIPSSSPRAEEQALYRSMARLLEDYVFNSYSPSGPLISVEYVDIFKDLAKAEILNRQYNLEHLNSVLVVAGDRHRILRADDLMTFSQQRPVSFSGEAAVTSAIIEVTQESTPVLYFTRGHGETLPGTGNIRNNLSRLETQLQSRNFKIAELDLSRVSSVPEDAGAIVVSDPLGPFLDQEVELLRIWMLEGNGRLMLWQRPGVNSNLDPLLRDWGLVAPDLAVHEPDIEYREPGGNLMIRNLGEHPVTQSLIDQQVHVLSGWSRPILPRTSAPVDERLTVVPLMASSSNSWAESNYTSQTPPTYDATADSKGPVPIAFAAERRAASQLGIRLQGGRLVVIGSGDIFSNSMLSSLGNQTLFFNSVNWLIQRENFLSIPPKPIESWQLTISENQLRQIGLAFLGIPGCIALFGFAIYWLRHS